MFEIIYKIVCSEYDDFAGENGFLQIKFNNFQYGEMYPEELYDIMDKVSLHDWIERLIRVAKYLRTNDYVALSDVESYNKWLEFKKKGQNVIVSIVKAKKAKGSKDVELDLQNSVAGEWTNQVISYDEFQSEIYVKGGEYIRFITENNKESNIFENLRKEYENIL
ncbi:MAG: hypothetical protein IJ711_10080 [Lachnospiraceae bacterium]|nr:hypothetical protein [Lachnospiraceae bacterium]